jgi:hypothetical protein
MDSMDDVDNVDGAFSAMRLVLCAPGAWRWP